MKTKKLILSLFLFLTTIIAIQAQQLSGSYPIPINNETFPDPFFRNYIETTIDQTKDGQLDKNEIFATKSMMIAHKEIQSLQGLQYFIHLDSLDCSCNNIACLNLSHNANLKYLRADSIFMRVLPDENNKINLNSLPGFDLVKSSNIEGGIRMGENLIFDQNIIKYHYATDYTGTASIPEKLPFMLVIGTTQPIFNPTPSSKQEPTIDTIYYDKNGKGVKINTFATYYRLIPHSEDSCFDNPKPFKDFYLSGELKMEGMYLFVNRQHDSASIFEGKMESYYKTGNEESIVHWANGKLNGEFIFYDENGLILRHGFCKNGQLDGVYTEFREDGLLCAQIEYENGTPINDICILSNDKGQISPVSISTGVPIYLSPDLSEKETQYIAGQPWPYYNKNGLQVCMTMYPSRDYGKYYYVQFHIINNSIFPIDIEPTGISAVLIDKNEEKEVLHVLSDTEYLKKVRRRQNAMAALVSFGEAYAASQAGYSSSTTTTTYGSTSVGSGIAISSDGSAIAGYGSSATVGAVSTTSSSYNGAAAYQAQIIASNRIAQYQNSLLEERNFKDANYIKKNTLYPGSSLDGYVNIKYKKGNILYISINLNGATYVFPWDIAKKKKN